jgi:hypothetical protein
MSRNNAWARRRSDQWGAAADVRETSRVTRGVGNRDCRAAGVRTSRAKAAGRSFGHPGGGRGGGGSAGSGTWERGEGSMGCSKQTSVCFKPSTVCSEPTWVCSKPSSVWSTRFASAFGCSSAGSKNRPRGCGRGRILGRAGVARSDGWWRGWGLGGDLNPQ